MTTIALVRTVLRGEMGVPRGVARPQGRPRLPDDQHGALLSHRKPLGTIIIPAPGGRSLRAPGVREQPDWEPGFPAKRMLTGQGVQGSGGHVASNLLGATVQGPCEQGCWEDEKSPSSPRVPNGEVFLHLPHA